MVLGITCKCKASIYSVNSCNQMAMVLQGALGYYGSCYQFVTRRYTWAGAEKYCTSKKGHLVTINDR